MNVKLGKQPKFIDKGKDPNAEFLSRIADSFGFKDDTGGVAFRLFVFGTCNGLYRVMPDAVEILAVVNEKPGNGQFTKLMRELGRMAKGKLVRFREMLNDKLTRHLIEKYQFTVRGKDCEGTVIS
jgi:hypothetical protein